jgi:O-antigen/teichoic acid export membrane protein
MPANTKDTHLPLMAGFNDKTTVCETPATGSRLALYAIAYAGSTAFHKGLGFLVFMWLAYELPVAAYASFGLLYALYSGVAALSMAGIVDTVIGLLVARSTAGERQRLFVAAERVFYSVAVSTISVVGLCLVLFPSAIALPWIAVAAATAAGLFTALFTIRSHLRRLDEDHNSSLLLSFLPPLAGLIGATVAFLATRSVTGFFCGYALAMLAGFAVYRPRPGQWAHGVNLSADTHSIFARLGPFLLVAMLAWLGGYGNTWLVRALFSAEDVARFAFIYTLASVMQLVATSLNQVWSPRIFKQLQQQSVALVDASSSRFFLLQGLALGTFGALLLVIAPWLVELGGARLAPYSNLNNELFILLAAYALTIPWYHVQNYFLAFGKGRELMKMSVVSTAVGMALWVAAMWVLGPVGVYVGFLLLTIARTVAAQSMAWRMWQVATFWQGPLLALLLLMIGSMLGRLAGA